MKEVEFGEILSLLAQGPMIGIGNGIAIIALIIVIILLIVLSKRSKTSSTHELGSEQWLNETPTIINSRKTVLIETVHFLLMILLTIPVYLYGGNVLYGHTLFLKPDELVAFTIRAVLSVLSVEILFNWFPYFLLRLRNWRERGWYIVLSGISFAILTYLVIPTQYHEGEAFIGMGFVWTFCGAVIHFLFRRIGWYDRKSD